MALDNILEGTVNAINSGRDLIASAHKSGHLYTFIGGAGAMALVSLSLSGCPSSSTQAAKNLEPQVNFSQPTKFDVIDGKLYLRNYMGGKTVIMESKKSQDGMIYFQGSDGGDVLIPAKIGPQGSLEYK